MEPVIAVDIGGTSTRIALVSGDGTILAKTSFPTPTTGHSPDILPKALIREIPQFLNGSPAGAVAAIGISAAGPIDFKTGDIVNPPNLGFPRIPLVKPLETAFGIPVRAINDCHAGMMGEAGSGAAKGVDCALYITLSTGIGGAYIEQGRMLLGKSGNSLEIGHFIVDTKYGLPCGCGHSGHWEAYASGKHIPQFFRKWREHHGIPAPQFPADLAEDIFAAARAGDVMAEKFIEELGRINARAISDIVVAFDPALIVMDGSIAIRNPDLLIPPIGRYADRFLPLPDIQVSSLEGLAPLLGAAVIARGYDTPFGSFSRFL